MIRRNVMLSPPLDDKLAAEAIKEQVSKSEILRRALDVYFAKVRKERKE